MFTSLQRVGVLQRVDNVTKSGHATASVEMTEMDLVRLDDARAGRLDRNAVEAVPGAAGSRETRARRAPRHSPRTVQNDVAHIYDKIGVYSRAGAALFVTEQALLD